MVDSRHEYDRIASLYVPIAAGVVVLVLLLVVGFALRYRARAGGAEPSRTHDAPVVEGLYVLALAAVAAFLLWRTFTVEDRVDAAATARPSVLVNVTAAKWHWTFAYPATGIVQRGSDQRRPTLVVPAGRVVGFHLESVDVVHAFWVPSRRFKRDATPGFATRFTLVFPRTGTWVNGGECSEFCGLHHWQMRFDVRVVTPAAFAAWERARAAGGGAGGGAPGGATAGAGA